MRNTVQGTDGVILPNWPALMDEEMAAAYLSLSATSFRGLAARRGCRPIDLGFARVRWRKNDLDRLVADLPVRAARANVEFGGEDTATAAALTKVRKRAGWKAIQNRGVSR